MNFKLSKKFEKEILKAKNVLLSCHESPDIDSIVSCLVMGEYTESLGKKVTITSVHAISDIYKTLYPKGKILESVDYGNFDFSAYDLIIALDISDLKRLGKGFSPDKKARMINLDHHENNLIDTDLKIIDTSYSATSEMVMYFLEDMDFKINSSNAGLLLAGIISDSDNFTYSASVRLFESTVKLMKLGAQYEEILSLLTRNNSLDQLKFWSKALANTKMDKAGRFAYTTLNYEEYSEYTDLVKPKRTVADKFLRTLKGTDFGVVMVEDKDKNMTVSVRSRKVGYGVVDIVEKLGGGGHFDGGGAVIKEVPFDEAVKRVLEVAREHSDKNNK